MYPGLDLGHQHCNLPEKQGPITFLNQVLTMVNNNNVPAIHLVLDLLIISHRLGCETNISSLYE